MPASDRAELDLVLVGDGADRDQLSALADELAPGRVKFLGWTDDVEMLRSLYSAAEMLVLPRELLCSDVDQWEVRLDFLGAIPVGAVDRVMVRSYERLESPSGRKANG